MLTELQIAMVEHLLEHARRLPPRYPLAMSAGEFLRLMGEQPVISPPALAAIPKPAEPRPPASVSVTQSDGFAGCEIPLRFNRKQSDSQRRRWQAQNAASERALIKRLARGPGSMQDLAFDLRWSLSRVSKFLKRLEAVSEGGIYSLPGKTGTQRMAS